MNSVNSQLEYLKNHLLKDKSYLFIDATIHDSSFVENYFISNAKIILADNVGALDSIRNYKYYNRIKLFNYQLLKNFYVSFSLTNLSQVSFDTKKLMVTLHAFFRIINLSRPKEIEIKSLKDYYDKIQNYPNSSWFRGHANSSWELIPSFFRDIRQQKENFDFDLLISDLKDKKIIDKLGVVFGTNTINYRKLAFLQHSIGYSPFLDFSKSPEIGLSFALSNMENITQFFHRESCVYELDIWGITPITDEYIASEVIKHLNITVIKGNTNLHSILKSKMWLDFIKGSLDSKILLIDIQTNDRMTYQKGAFLLFNNVLIIGDKMLLSLEKQEFMSSRMTKYTISTRDRLNIYKDFQLQFPQYQLRYLMNPYSHMQE